MEKCLVCVSIHGIESPFLEDRSLMKGEDELMEGFLKFPFS